MALQAREANEADWPDIITLRNRMRTNANFCVPDQSAITVDQAKENWRNALVHVIEDVIGRQRRVLAGFIIHIFRTHDLPMVHIVLDYDRSDWQRAAKLVIREAALELRARGITRTVVYLDPIFETKGRAIIRDLSRVTTMQRGEPNAAGRAAQHRIEFDVDEILSGSV